MEKLKICHISLTVYPDRRDGSAKFQRYLYEELKSRGHDITLLTAKWNKGFEDPNIKTIDVPKSRFLWIPKFAQTYKKYLKNNDFDIIQGNASRGSIPAILSKKPYLSHIHDVGTFQSSFSKIPGLKSLERKNAQKAKKIMCCADSAKQEISHYMKIPLEKITNVSSAVSPIFKPSPNDAKSLRNKLNIEGPIIFYVGRIAFYKGVEDIINAYKIAKKEIPNLNLIIGGKPTLKMKNEVEKWKVINPDIHFAGMIPEDEMKAYYSMANIFTTYSYASEGFGLTPVEALSCGTPVICSSLACFKEVLQNNAAFIEPKRPKLLANEFIKYINNPEIGIKQVKNATDLLKTYSWNEVCTKVENVYKNYLENQ